MNNVDFNRKVLVQDGESWKSVDFANLKDGDRFKLFESDDTFVGEYFAVGSPYINEDRIWTIKCDDVNAIEEKSDV
jgi:hypothetical protein